jgi:undecaprenyl diphosphate synthase
VGQGAGRAPADLLGPFHEREIETLMRLFEQKFKEAVSRNEFHENKIRFRVFGDRTLLPAGIMRYINSLENSTKGYSEYFANIVLGYGGRQELVAACNAAIRDYEQGKIKAVDEKNFSNYLYTGGLADPDLIIRTSGEQRLSGFLPWQSAYSEFYFSKKLWPDFTKREMRGAVEDFSERKRRFGR